MKAVKICIALLVTLPLLAAAELNIVVVDPEQALAGTSEVKARIGKFQDDMKGQESKMQSLRDQIMKLEERLQKDAVTMTRDQAQKLTDERDTKMIEFQSLQKMLQQRMQQSQEELQKTMMPKLQQAIRELSAEEEYDLVLVRQAVLFVSDAVDVTDKVTAKLNQSK